VLRPQVLLKVREAYGAIHYFTHETALQSLRDAGRDAEYAVRD
jgi:hypothetical protein